MGTLGPDSPGGTTYPPEEPTPEPTGECCDLISLILEKVDAMEDRLDSLLAEFMLFKGGSSWERQWNYELEALFTQDDIDAKLGPGVGFAGLFQLCKQQYEFLMDIHKDLAAKESFVAVPEYWPIMKEHQRPQLVVQSAQEIEPRKLGSANYVTAIPHYRYTDYTDFPPFDSLAKGSTQGMLVLNDNSKVIIYAQNQNEANRVLGQIESVIEPAMLKNSYRKLGKIRGEGFKETTVYPKYARYYPQGAKEKFAWQVGYPF